MQLVHIFTGGAARPLIYYVWGRAPERGCAIDRVKEQGMKTPSSGAILGQTACKINDIF